MSAYLHQKNAGGFTIAQGPISQFNSGADFGADLLTASHSVPHIMSEIENFVSQFKNAEAALIQERTKALQIWQELRELRSKFDRVKLEYEEKIAEKIVTQDKLQSDLMHAQELEKKLRQDLLELEQRSKALEEEKRSIQEESKKAQWSAVNQERERTHQYYHQLKTLYSQYVSIREQWVEKQKKWTQQLSEIQHRHAVEKKRILEAFAEDKAKVLEEKKMLTRELAQVNEQLGCEKHQIQLLKAQIVELGRVQEQRALERDELRKKAELLKSKLLQYHQAYQKVHGESQRLKGELEQVRLQLSQIQAEGAQGSGFDSLGIDQERKNRQHLEDLLEQERKDKELALKELEVAENKMTEVSRELNTLKQQWMQDQGIASQGLELRF